MAVDYRFALDKSPKKYSCPQCGKKTFVLFRDHDGSYAPDIFGRCDREQKCGYFARPSDERVIVEPRKVPQQPPSNIHESDLRNTLTGYDHNSLFRFLSGHIGQDSTSKLFDLYCVGIDQTNPGTRDWCVYWQITYHGDIRGGKMIRYKPDGHRDHDHNATWYHSCHRDRYPEYNLVQCFFGEHLLKLRPTDRVAVVESEKTAIIAAHHLPEYVWIATGGKGGLNKTKCEVLQNRNVTLFPDLGAYDDWRIKATEYGFTVSRMLEDIATEEQREQGLDLADFLIKIK